MKYMQETKWMEGKNPRKRTKYEMGFIKSTQSTGDKQGFTSFEHYVKEAQKYFPRKLKIRCRELKTMYQTEVRQNTA